MKTMRKQAESETRGPVQHSPMKHPRHQYPEESAALQELARSCGPVEKIKWGKPCFTLRNKKQPTKPLFSLHLTRTL